jgi:hypothetical protein
MVERFHSQVFDKLLGIEELAFTANDGQVGIRKTALLGDADSHVGAVNEAVVLVPQSMLNK